MYIFFPLKNQTSSSDVATIDLHRTSFGSGLRLMQRKWEMKFVEDRRSIAWSEVLKEDIASNSPPCIFVFVFEFAILYLLKTGDQSEAFEGWYIASNSTPCMYSCWWNRWRFAAKTFELVSEKQEATTFVIHPYHPNHTFAVCSTACISWTQSVNGKPENGCVLIE